MARWEAWLEEARQHQDPTEIDRRLDLAEAAATSATDRLALLRAFERSPLVSGRVARMAEIARVTLEAAIDDPHVWNFRDVARVRAGRLGDPDGAIAALEAGEAAFARLPTARGYQWALLAAGYAALRDDARAESGVQRCLEDGRRRAHAARSVSDLSSVATTAYELGDAGAGRALAHEAEVLARARVAGGSAFAEDAWSLANTYQRIGDPESAARVLAAALEEATTTDHAIQVAKALASHHRDDALAEALAKAEALADGAKGWLAIAEARFDLRRVEADLRRAVERAEALVRADEPHLREAIAAAYRRWLDDPEAAARLGASASGVRPDARRVVARRLDGWTGAASELFDALRSRVSREALVALSRLDYGFSEDKHFAALADTCARGLVPRGFAYYPGEVLELCRWSSGPTLDRNDHLSRALACTLLCIDLGPVDSSFEETAAQLVESALEIGGDLPALAERFLVWLCETNAARDDANEDDEDDEDDGADPTALVALALLVAHDRPGDPRLDGLVDALTRHPWCPPARLRQLLRASVSRERWDALVDRVAPRAQDHPATESLVRLLRPPAR